jgi:Antitoxin FitA-like, ribbon-helix-helix
MPGLMIRNLPPDLHEQLKNRAKAHRRSLTAEVVVILQESLNDRAGSRRLEDVDRLRVRGARPLTQDIVDAGRETGRP